MRSNEQVILANRAWAQELTEQRADYFQRQTGGQRPDFLWIGCSDSRVDPAVITQSAPGELFIHRNVANLVHDDDMNLLSALQFAVETLEVPHIVVCGHYGCGGLQAALDGNVEGPIATWLENARCVHANHADEIDMADDREMRVNRFVECNVRDQLLALARTPIVQNAFARGQVLELHGWVYDIRDGLLKPMLEITAATDLDSVGRPAPVLA